MYLCTFPISNFADCIFISAVVIDNSFVAASGDLSKANVDLFNIASKVADEDPLRTSSPWSVSSGGVSPMPATPHSTLQLEDIVHATVIRHLFGPEHHSQDIHMKPRRQRQAKPVDKGKFFCRKHILMKSVMVNITQFRDMQYLEILVTITQICLV
jgi:hypothetical protein